jgi:GNAT superfamily N-acetyltransferase
MKDPAHGDPAVIAAEENLFAYIRLFATRGGNDFFEDGRILRFISGIDIPSMQSNSVYKMALGGDGDVDDGIHDLLRPFKERKLPLFLTVGPSSGPPGLEVRLKKNGFSHAQSQRGMVIDMAAYRHPEAAPGDVRIKRVETPEELKAWLTIYSDGFDYSRSLGAFIFERYRDLFFDGAVPAFHYIAFMNGKPAATSTLFVSGTTGGLYNIITVPGARRRGIGAAMTAVALDKARELACTRGVLQATPMGAPVYRKIGFRDICAFELYMKLHGKSRVTFPASYVGKKIVGSLRGLRRL